MNEITDDEALRLIGDERLLEMREMGESLDEFVAERGRAMGALKRVFEVDQAIAEKLTKTDWSTKNSYVENEAILTRLGVGEEVIRRLINNGKSLGRKMVDSSLKKVGREGEDPIYVKMVIDLARAVRDYPLLEQGHKSLGRKQTERAVAWDLKMQGVKSTEGSRYSQAPVSLEHQKKIWSEILGISL